ncbi:MAG: LemA family protein [Myxococcales bacterium]|nr:MAG: LemA family protein [Myxococcales bacterium]
MKRLVATAAGILAAFLLFGTSGCGYNTAIGLEEEVNSQWSQIEVQLKRRYDLIPNLVETVKGYAAHESELFTEIAKVRESYFNAPSRDEKVEAATRLEGALSRLLLLKENYPQLKADQSFLKLQDSIEGTENRIAVERKRYNDAVRDLNSYIRGIPGKWWASLAGVKQARYFEVREEEKAVPAVKF